MESSRGMRGVDVGCVPGRSGRDSLITYPQNRGARLRPPTSDALAECNSIALGSVQALQRSRIPRWPMGRDPPLRIGRKTYDDAARPVHVSLELVHSPVTRARPKSRAAAEGIPSQFAPGRRPVTAPKISGRDALLSSLGISVGAAAF